MARMPIYTIGYGARTLEEFVALLQERQIQFLLDVRSKPYSRYKPEFSKAELDKGIQYVFMGDSLGGQPSDPDCYTAGGKVDYEKIKRKPFYQDGIGRLQQAWQQHRPVVLMCSEGKPENCHRSKLIGETLAVLGIEVAHIDENGSLLTQDEVKLRVIGGQPSLFGPDFHQLTSRKRYDPGSDSEDST
ncbi:MAG: hypothetical protein AMJ56_21260 [Anaerolineae bacterium SG8_19]|nr:MAG: hypothetical protein AMJ56_21260 [Anaerolineae bacterium SG8_19]